MTRIDERIKFMKLKARAEELTAKYNWYDEKVRPYSYQISVREVLKECEDYDDCTRGSQEYLYLLIKGLVEILEAWEQTELSKVWVIYKGKRRRMAQEVIENLRECGEEIQILEEK